MSARPLALARCLLVGALVAIDLGPVSPSHNADRIRDSAARPVPALPAPPAPPGAGVWVPDRYVPYPGEHGGVFVPGHWELPIGDGRVQVPPVTVEGPDTGRLTTLPGGVRTLPAGAPEAP